MSCPIDEITALLSAKPVGRALLSSLRDNEADAETLFGDMVLEEYGVAATELNFSNFSRGFKKLLFSTVQPSITRDGDWELGNIQSIIDNGFQTARSYNTTGDIVIHKFIPKAASIAKLAEAVPKGRQVNLEEVSKDAQTVADTIRAARGSGFLLHELVHSASQTYLQHNTGTTAAKTVNSLFQHLLGNREKLGISEGYWMTNRDEFLAEALSNPILMKELMSIRVTKPVNNITTVYGKVLSDAVAITGSTSPDTLFAAVLNSNLQMLEQQGFTSSQGPKASKSTISELDKEIEAIKAMADEIVAGLPASIQPEAKRILKSCRSN